MNVSVWTALIWLSILQIQTIQHCHRDCVLSRKITTVSQHQWIIPPMSVASFLWAVRLTVGSSMLKSLPFLCQLVMEMYVHFTQTHTIVITVDHAYHNNCYSTNIKEPYSWIKATSVWFVVSHRPPLCLWRHACQIIICVRASIFKDDSMHRIGNSLVIYHVVVDGNWWYVLTP